MTNGKAVYAVAVEGGFTGSFDSPEAAVKAASRHVYLGSARRADVIRLLEAGQIAEWCYGFAGVSIVPRALANTVEPGSAEWADMERVCVDCGEVYTIAEDGGNEENCSQACAYSDFFQIPPEEPYRASDFLSFAERNGL